MLTVCSEMKVVMTDIDEAKCWLLSLKHPLDHQNLHPIISNKQNLFISSWGTVTLQGSYPFGEISLQSLEPLLNLTLSKIGISNIYFI